MGKSKGKQRKQVTLPPELPPEITEDEIEVSDEDLQFVDENTDYAGFVSRLDTHSITRQVTRVEGLSEDALEALYEKRRRKALEQKENEKSVVQVDPLDALPVKTLDGEVYYRTFSQIPEVAENEEGNEDKSIVKLTKAERRAKLKRSKKEAKKQGKELAKTEEVQPTQQEAVLAEVKEDLMVEETFETKKCKLAELGMALLADPESNIKSLKEMLQFAKDGDHSIVKLGLLSLLAVFKDIIPGYRIRLPTEKELEMKVSKEVKKMRFYESTLLSAYKGYLQKLLALDKQPIFHHVVVRCICTLLDAVPHFNFRESLLGAVVRNIGSSDDVVRRLCCATIKSLFTNEGKHGGEATVEAVRLIADHVKAHDCQLHPDSVEVLMSLSFDEDLGKPEVQVGNNKMKNKKNKKRKNIEETNQIQGNDRKKGKREMMAKMKEEVAADYKAVAYTPDVEERKKMQSETLSAVFETYFRILRHTTQSSVASSEANGSTAPGASGAHPLLAPCLSGLGKFSHLIDLDYIGDLVNYLKRLASGGSNSDGSAQKVQNMTVSECLRCCIVAFKVMRSNLDALNVDLQDFFVQLYNLVLEYRPGRDQGEVLAEALKIMLCDDRQHDMQKAAAFVKRLATFSLCFGSAESMAALVTLKNLLQKNVKCRNLLENDAGGGSVSGSIAKYQPHASDPNLSGALASVLWELDLLSKHYHPTISTLASSISGMNTAQNQVYLSISPQQAFINLSLEQESFNPKFSTQKSNNKRKRGTGPSTLASINPTSIDENEVSKKLSRHFMLLRDIKENERVRGELDRTKSSLQLYEEYKKQTKSLKHKTKKSKKRLPVN
ncbi:nucleolar complex protein 3 homolog isoform X2 [Herrania umbratica]|uniref:Nucleolar complex protein 3 homolog isoform X2 n=1 Tax=Herrania umbratica TaxID=108875 RepID=A0A6J1AN34_9ROSI|nr:nucleolar complex protein 3 homolog isoform X2 [Herrania umbratica]